MKRLSRLALAAAAAAGAACGSKVPESPIRLSEPSALAVFDGVTAKNPGSVHPYVAIANAGRDDLTLVDAVDDRAVLAPALSRSLAVPVPAPRPTMLVASSLFDGDDASPPAAATADLLVVVSAGVPILELVDTWSGSPAVVAGQAVDLAAVAPGAEILALEAAPVPDGATPPGRTPGRVRVLAALTGARLAVVEYGRAPDGGIAAGAVALRDLAAGGAPFDAVDLAVNPFDAGHLYAASTDPIGGVMGVAELDVRGDPAAWTVRAIDARGPTRLVAAWRLQERKPAETGEPPGAFEATAVDRVYAWLDPSGCGRERRVPCGLAVLDPVAGRILPDLPGTPPGGSVASPLMPYLAPIAIPGLATALAISGPPARAPAGAEAFFQPPWMRLNAGTGARGTSAVMAVPSSNGRVYVVDLARWAIPNDRSILRGDSRTRVTSAVASTIEGTARRLGLWDPRDDRLKHEGSDLIPAVRVTPGFTQSETFTVTFQGEMPGFTTGDLNPAETGRLGDGRTWLALQTSEAAPGGGRSIFRAVRVYDPAFGLRAGDIALFAAPDVPGCPGPKADGSYRSVEARLGAILPPTPEYPGGAVALDPSLTDQTVDDPSTTEFEGPFDWPACVASLADGYALPIAIFRAAELVAVGSVTGYAGRPQVVYPDELATSTPFTVAYEDEDALTCPFDPWPADPGAVACDDACRAQCERLVLARKTRRFYHLSDSCAGTADTAICLGNWPGYAFPVANGPLVSFTVGYKPEPVGTDEKGNPTGDPGGRLPVDDQKLWGALRNLQVTFTTQAGVSPTARSSGTSSSVAPVIMPLGAATFDRSPYQGKEGEAYRFYTPYVYDYVLDFSPAQAINQVVVIR